MLRSRPNFFSSRVSTSSGSSTIEVPAKWQNSLGAIYDYLSESKKIKQREYKTRTTLFTAIGLCLSLAIVIVAFEWTSSPDNDLVELGNLSAEFEEIMEVPVTEQPPPPPPKAQVAIITEVPDVVEIQEEIEINLDVEVTEESLIEDVVYDVTNEVEEEVADEIFQFVEQQPEPKGGMKAFYQYVSKNMVYPALARRSAVEGKVYVQFVIDKDGSINNVVILKGIGFGCDEEAKRVLESSPKWKPGKQRGKPVRVRMSLPIVFTLENV